MAYSNANYLISPSRLSTKVHHAPGGASSLSLAWDDPEKPKWERPKKQQSQSYQPVKEPPNFIQSPSQLSKEQAQFLHKNYYEPSYSGYLNLSESNRLLEEELRYYQSRNKALRSNIFASQEQKDLRSGYSGGRAQYSYEFGSNKYSDDEYFSRSQDYGQGRGRQRQQLQMAVLQQQKRRELQRQEGYGGVYSIGQKGQAEKSSVKVSNPPGGKSSIVFG